MSGGRRGSSTPEEDRSMSMCASLTQLGSYSSCLCMESRGLPVWRGYPTSSDSPLTTFPESGHFSETWLRSQDPELYYLPHCSLHSPHRHHYGLRLWVSGHPILTDSYGALHLCVYPGFTQLALNFNATFHPRLCECALSTHLFLSGHHH